MATFLRSSATLIGLIGCLGLALAGAAHAQALSSPVTVTLSAPGGSTGDGGVTLNTGPLSLTEPVSSGATIDTLSGGDIGNFMLSTESITFSGTSIMVRVAQGSSDGTTGYLGSGGLHAQYEFTGLQVPGYAITGLTYLVADGFVPGPVSGVTGLPVSAVHLTSAHSLVLELDQIHFVDRGHGESNNFADVRIDLQTTAVPEPESYALLLSGLVAVAALGAKRRPPHQA